MITRVGIIAMVVRMLLVEMTSLFVVPGVIVVRVRVWLPIRAQNIKQKCDILGANLSTFHLDPSIVQSFAPFSVLISVLVFLRLE